MTTNIHEYNNCSVTTLSNNGKFTVSLPSGEEIHYENQCGFISIYQFLLKQIHNLEFDEFRDCCIYTFEENGIDRTVSCRNDEKLDLVKHKGIFTNVCEFFDIQITYYTVVDRKLIKHEIVGNGRTSVKILQSHDHFELIEQIVNNGEIIDDIGGTDVITYSGTEGIYMEINRLNNQIRNNREKITSNNNNINEKRIAIDALKNDDCTFIERRKISVDYENEIEEWMKCNEILIGENVESINLINGYINDLQKKR